MPAHHHSRYLIVLFISVLSCSAAAGLVASKLYWGYWYKPPALHAVRSVRTIESFVAIWPPRTIRPRPKTGPAAFRAAARSGMRNDPSSPLGRIPAELARLGVSPRSDDAAAAKFLDPAIRVLRQRNVLAAGEPGYEQAQRFDYAYLAIARTDRSTPLLLLATRGGQVSNDHYPYYEAAFEITPAGELEPLQINHFYYDIAGLEGVTARGFAIAAFIPVSAFGVVAYCVLLTLKRAT